MTVKEDKEESERSKERERERFYHVVITSQERCDIRVLIRNELDNPRSSPGQGCLCFPFCINQEGIFFSLLKC